MVRIAGIATYVQTAHDDRDDVVGRGLIDITHDQSLLVSETRVAIEVGVTRWFGASLVLPFRLVSTEITYLDTDGREVQLVRDGLHHRDETVSGLGDPMLLGAISGARGGWRWTARAGLTLPLGRTEEDPFTLGDQGLAHQHLQMGNGTVNPVLAGEVSRAWGPWRLGGFAFTQQVVYANGLGYQAGDRYAGGASLSRRLGAWTARGGVEVQAETAERWGGVVHTDDGNRGRIDALLVAGGVWSVTDRLALDLAVKVPVVTHVVGGQLDMPAIVELGAAWRFGGATRAKGGDDGHGHGDEHDHDHAEHGEHGEHGEHDEHGEHGGDAPYVHPDTTGLDVVDLGPAGAAVELVPVPGKLTIFDFWATWCQPCKLLEPALVDLARAHPDVVAIRRVDAVDWDSPAVARYLTPGGFDLPHLKIYDARGQLVLEQSSAVGSLDALIAAVRSLVEQAATTAPTTTAPTTTPPIVRAPARSP